MQRYNSWPIITKLSFNWKYPNISNPKKPKNQKQLLNCIFKFFKSFLFLVYSNKSLNSLSVENPNTSYTENKGVGFEGVPFAWHCRASPW